MFTFCRLPLVVAVAWLAVGCERTPLASAEEDAGRLLAANQGAATAGTQRQSDASLRAILGAGDAGFVPKFLSPHTIGNSAILQIGHRVRIGGTAQPVATLDIQDDFTGTGTFGFGSLLHLHQVDPTGDITIQFSQSPLNPQDVLGNMGVVRSRDGKPERFVVLGGPGIGAGSNPRNLPLVLAEDAGNVGIGIANPSAKLDVVGSARVRGDLTVFDGRVHLGGTATPAGRLQISDNFPGFGPTGQILQIHQIDPTGDIVVDFARSGVGVVGNMGVIHGGGRERFVILGNGRSPSGLPLTLQEDRGNVGIGTSDPQTKLDVVGNTRISGNLSVTGTKSSVATLADGRRVLLYAIESPQNWFEDFGAGRLTAGEAWVPLEGVFAETVNTGGSYHVFLTPNGNCKGLYVAEKRPDGFLVRELGGGRSSVTFDYRIVAPRRGFETVRLHELP